MIRRCARCFAVADQVRLTCTHCTPQCTILAGESAVVVDIDPDDNNLIVVALDREFSELHYRRNLICVTAADVERIGC